LNLEPSYKNITTIAAPIMLFNFVQSAIGFTDTIFLGRVGVVEMSACGIMAIYYLVFVMVGFGISRAAQILIARRMGAQRYDEIGVVADHLLILEMGTAVILFMILHFGSSYIVPWFIQSEEILVAGWDYLSYRSYGIFFSLLAFVLLAVYTGVGKTRAIIVVTVVLASVNVVLNYTLIFGKFGFAPMGIAGAGLASTLSEIISAVAGMIYLFFDPLRDKLQLFKFKNINVELMKRLLRLSIPLVFQYLVGLGGWFIFFTFIENLGEQALAISVVLRWLYTFYMIPAIGASAAVNTLVSNSIGQEKYDLAKSSIKKCITYSFVITGFSIITMFIFPEAIANIFTDDLTIIIETPKLYWILGLILMICSVSTVLFNGLMGAGATNVSLLIEAVAVVLYLSYAFLIVNVMNKGLHYAWFSECVYWTLLLVFTSIYFYTGRWRSHDV